MKLDLNADDPKSFFFFLGQDGLELFRNVYNPLTFHTDKMVMGRDNRVKTFP